MVYVVIVCFRVRLRVCHGCYRGSRNKGTAARMRWFLQRSFRSVVDQCARPVPSGMLGIGTLESLLVYVCVIVFVFVFVIAYASAMVVVADDRTKVQRHGASGEASGGCEGGVPDEDQRTSRS